MHFPALRLPLFAALLLCLQISAVTADDHIELPDELAADKLMLTGERPGKDAGPTEVYVGTYIFDIAEIDDVNQLMTADIYSFVSWNDPRLAMPEDQRKGQLRNVSRSDIWLPQGLIVNDRGLQRQLPEVATIDDEGKVTVRQRLWGRFAIDLDFEDFPFDTQYLPIEIISYAYSPEELKFSDATDISGDDGKFSAEGWSFEIQPPVLSEYDVPAFNTSRPMLTYYIKAERNTEYYLLTMFLPMTMIIFMAWSVYWLQPDIIPARIGISTASIFSFVAFGLSIRSRIPEVSYMTLADVFVTGCTLLVFTALAITVWGSRLANAGHMDAALRVNRIARPVYPLLYVLICAYAVLR
jgi:hypothetical protein